MRTIAPYGMLHTYEFNGMRAEAARVEFERNKISHLVNVHHRVVYGKECADDGGFDVGRLHYRPQMLSFWICRNLGWLYLTLRLPLSRIVDYAPILPVSSRHKGALLR